MNLDRTTKNIADMSDDELINHIANIRGDRRAAPIKKEERKVSSSVDKSLSQMSREQLLKLKELIGE